MVRKMSWLSLFLAIIISLGFFTLKGFGREEKLDKKVDLGVISEKIEEVLKNQKDIISRLEDIRAQQDIIRVRASHR